MQAGVIMGNLASAIGLSLEETTLIAELKAGSEEAFAQIIAQYHQPIFSLIARSLDDPSDAADITQEVFLKVFRSIRSFHGDSSLRTWIYRIALREASNQRRWWSRHRRREVTLDTPASSEAEDDAPTLAALLADGNGTPLDHAEQNQLREHLEAALRDLPEAFRTVVVLREVEGFAYDEIADLLSINIGTVKSRLTRGRHLLRAALQPFLDAARSARPQPRSAATPSILSRRSA